MSRVLLQSRPLALFILVVRKPILIDLWRRNKSIIEVSVVDLGRQIGKSLVPVSPELFFR